MVMKIKFTKALQKDSGLLLMNRPGFTRHFLAYKFRPSRGCHEWEAIYRGISN